MKKFVIALLLILCVFSGCSAQKPIDLSDESNVAAYIPAGQMTVLELLVESNRFFVEEVFVANHLPIDESKTINNENGSFAPVVSDKIGSYSKLENMLKSTYTDAITEKLLSEKKYVEINGKLYFDMQYKNSFSYELDWSEYKISSSTAVGEKFEITVTARNAKHKKTEITLSAVNVDGNIRLENIYY